MARSGVLTGRSLSDVVYNAGILVVLMLSGLVVGWTVHDRPPRVPRRRRPAARSSRSRCRGSGSGSGLSVPTVEVANQVVFTTLFPITFISNVFVPPSTLPDFLQPIAEWNPTAR